MTTDYTILAAPRIRLNTFQRLLIDVGSPAAPTSAACWRAFVDAGVDPALALAVFRKESSYGRAGVAVRSRSWGNLRTSPTYSSRDGFVHYPSWEVGARDCARLLAIYGRNAIRRGVVTSSALTFPFVWAPAADGNAPAKYGRQIVGYIDAYLALEGVELVDPVKHLPPAIVTVTPGGDVYADPGRRDVLIPTWGGAANVGVYAIPLAAETWHGPEDGPAPLVPIRLDLAGGPAEELRIGWVGWDKLDLATLRIRGDDAADKLAAIREVLER